MRLTFLICKKEFKSYFASPIAYLLMAVFGLIFGGILYRQIRIVMAMSFQAQMMGQSQPTNLNEMIIRPLLGFASTVSLFLIPMITMRLIAEEKKTGTIELRLTSPVKDIQIILGKWFAALFLYLCILGMSALDIALLFVWGKPDWRPVLVAYLGLILQGGCLLAMGLFISTLTKNQIIAGGITFFLCLALLLIPYYFDTEYKTEWYWKAINQVSIVTHFENFSKGLLDLGDVVSYVSMIFLGLFITSRSMESLRWRS
jgi:ABC-2 type transport system permease protein